MNGIRVIIQDSDSKTNFKPIWALFMVPIFIYELFGFYGSNYDIINHGI
jgi:hypothetical protein